MNAFGFLSANTNDKIVCSNNDKFNEHNDETFGINHCVICVLL